jgi:hypothetical protein
MLKRLAWSILLISLTNLGSYPQAYAKEGEVVRIYFERTGGIAGMTMATTFDSATLSVDEANQLRQLIDTADFFHLPPNFSSLPPHPDRFQYKLTIEESGKCHTVVVNEEAVPEALRPLIKWLRAAEH